MESIAESHEGFKDWNIYHYTERRDPLNIHRDSEILVFKGAASLGEWNMNILMKVELQPWRIWELTFRALAHHQSELSADEAPNVRFPIFHGSNSTR